MASPKMTSGIFILSTIGAIFGIGSLVVFVFGGKKDPNSIVGEWESGGRVMEFRRGGELVDGKEKGSTGRPVPLLTHFLLKRAGKL